MSQDVNTLQPDPTNPRKISKEAYAALKRSIERFGDLSGVIFNQTTGHLVGGHQRVKVFQEMGGTIEIDQADRLDAPDKVGTIASGSIVVDGARYSYREVQWDEATERAANLAANKITGDWDEPLLAENLQALAQMPELLELTGFSDAEIDRLLNKYGHQDEEKPEVEFAQELKETRQYVVLTFDTEVDWLQFQSVFPLKSVAAFGSSEKYMKKGVSRVYPWAEFLKKAGPLLNKHE